LPSDAIAAVESVRKGPPWISIEYPPNPHDEASRNAFLLVNAFHHGTPMAFPVTGKAEGVVNGQRRTQVLELQRTSRPGVYALRKQWPDEGTWVLVLRVEQSKAAVATALVSLGRDGTIASVEVPSRTDGRWTIPRIVSDAEVESLLARRVASRE
jgi:hypothetical protein